jgi:hypothetical protein
MADADPKIDCQGRTIAINPIEDGRGAAREEEAQLGPHRADAQRALLLVALGGYFWLTSGRYVSTDNAYVQQDMISVSPDVTGRIVAVNVRENQRVKAGDVLFRIDPEPFASRSPRPMPRSPRRGFRSTRLPPTPAAPMPISRAPMPTSSSPRRPMTARRR